MNDYQLMKYITLMALLFLSPTIVSAQKTHKVRDKKTNEMYHVLESDGTTKQGEYKRYSFRNKLLTKGYYKFGQKDSVWESYDPSGNLCLKYDYSTNSVIYVEPENPRNKVRYRILDINRSGDTLSRRPIFLGGEGVLSDVLLRNLRYPDSAREAGKAGRVYIEFTVDKTGKTGNFHPESHLGYGLDAEALRVLLLLPDLWVPGLLNNIPVDVEVLYPITFSLD